MMQYFCWKEVDQLRRVSFFLSWSRPAQKPYSGRYELTTPCGEQGAGVTETRGGMHEAVRCNTQHVLQNPTVDSLEGILMAGPDWVA